MGVVYIPALVTIAVLAVYARSVLETRRVSLMREPWRAPRIAYAVQAALRGQPALLSVCWSCAWQRTVERVSDRLTPIESHDRLSEWWSEHVTMTRRLARYSAYRPRHSREALEVSLLKSDPLDIIWAGHFRTYWATWPTQFWPTLATGGSAYETVDSTTSIESFAR